ncbi:MAG: NAD(P)-dependent oxidoreductase [Pseudomonadota bacterium]
MKKIVLTGACGALGSRLRPLLAGMAEALVSTDIEPAPEELLANESFVQADLADAAAIDAIVEGAEMVVHFGAIPDEAPFDEILGPNILGSYHVWSAAAKHGVRRVVYASSIHAVGMHLKTDFIGVDAPHRPDGFYGLAKCFSEDLARLYWDKKGIEAVCLRILSCSAPTNARSIGSWLSYDDLLQLVRKSVDTPIVGFTVVYGVSDNDRCPVDNAGAAVLGYRPKDNAEDFAAEVFANSVPIRADDIAHTRHAGPFAATDLGESGVAWIKAQAARKG